MEPLIFTPTLMSEARGLERTAPLLLRWAARSDTQGQAFREQVERAARLVPEAQRRRVLGPISRRAREDQVIAAVDALLLAKTLHDLGWHVDHEPVRESLTPDLCIRRGDAEYIVEIRTVIGQLADRRQQYERVSQALDGVEGPFPLTITNVDLAPNASLKAWARRGRELVAGGDTPGPGVFSSPGVTVGYVLRDADPDGTLYPAVTGHQEMLFGNDADRVEKAIDEKLRKYRQPIIVAVDLIDMMYGFNDAFEAFYGARPIVQPLALGPPPHRNAYLGPAQGGILVGGDRCAIRARERLVALLPFVLRREDSGELAVRARLMANPAMEPLDDFAEFAPMPRLITAERTTKGPVMRWEPAEDPDGWSQVP